MNEAFYAYWLSTIPGIGCKKIAHLLKVYDSAEEIFKADERGLHACQGGIIRARDIESMLVSRDLERVKRGFDGLYEKKISFTYQGHADFPKKLLTTDSPPYSLFYRGRLPGEERPGVAIVGARNGSHGSMQVAGKFGRELAENGIDVISGLARGIDIASQKGVLTVAGGRTYGVLGCGIDICYPPEHIESYMLMQEHGGVISEFAPRIPPLARNFPMRNRIISGLADAVLVIEAGKDSGSLITAEFAMEQGRDVFVVPGGIFDDSYTGSNHLIQNGAALVTETKDILDGLGIFLDEDVSIRKKKNEVMLESDEKKVYIVLGLEPIHISEIVRMSGCTLQKTMEVLLSMELKGVVQRIGNQHYAVTL